MSSQVTGMKYSLVSKHIHSQQVKSTHQQLGKKWAARITVHRKFSQFWQHRRSCEWRHRPQRIQWCRSAARMIAPWCQCSQSTIEWEWTRWFPVWWQSRRRSMQIRRQQIHLRRRNCATTIDNPENWQLKNNYFIPYISDENRCLNMLAGSRVLKIFWFLDLCKLSDI